MKTVILQIICFVATLHLAAPAFAQAPSPVKIVELMTIVREGLARVFGKTANQISFTLKNTRSGDTASGVEVARTNDTLAIDVTPCDSEKTVVTFIKPYKETPVSDVRCGTRVYSRLQVIQE
jgi:hypothetical protein